MTDRPAYRFTGISPIFIVDSIQETIDFYTVRLGFEVLYTAEDEDGELFFTMLSRDDLSIMFKKLAPEVHPRSISQLAVKDTAIYDAFWHIEGPGQFIEDLKRKDVKIVKELTSTDYGTQEFVFEDLNGYQFLCGDKA